MAILSAEDILRNDGDVAKALGEKKEQAREVLARTGKMPEWWEAGVMAGLRVGKHRRKYATVEEFFAWGIDYFDNCAKEGLRPTYSGLTLWMGFSSIPHLIQFSRTNVEFREAHATLLTMLKLPLEQMLDEPGGQAGKIFLLKNIPEGFSPTDDTTAPLQYAWKDRQGMELTGANGGPVKVSRDIDPEEAYLRMLNGGVLEDKSE